MFARYRQLASVLVACVMFIPAGSALADPVKLLRDRPAEERPQLMLLGTAHFANHGLDVNNAQVPDVLEEPRQKQIEEVVAALARFKPTRIVVEMGSDSQEKLDARYAAYRAGTYQLTRSETDQLALRLAARLGHARVHAADWNRMPPGQIADFDYEQWARREGQQARLAAIRDKSRARRASEFMRDASVREWLAYFNRPDELELSNRVYFDYAMLGEPGANWLANWYGRNLKIFANLVRLAEGADERVLVVYGQGHVFLLRQFAEQSGAFRVVSPLEFLR